MDQLSPEAQRAYLFSYAIRIASISIAGYDYLETLPTVARFYYDQWRERRRSLGASPILFCLIRLTSLLVLIISNYGFFGRFTQAGCDRYILLPPAFKVVQGMVSHLILGLRAWTVSSKNKWIGYFLIGVFVVAVTFEWICTVPGRTAIVDSTNNCRSRSLNVDTLYSAWLYYAIVILYDVIATGITMFYLVRQLKTNSNGLLSQVVKSMVRDGMGYFAALTLINCVNMYFYLESQALQNAFASLGYTVTWIMSQRLILHLYKASLKKRSDQVMTSTGNGLLTISQNLTTNRSINNALRSQFSRKHETGFTDLTVPDFSMDLERPSTSTTIAKVDPEEQEDTVEVRVEKTVKISSNSRKVRYELENYSRGAIPSMQDGLRRL